MHAERMVLETDTVGAVLNMPALPANRRVEAIFLVPDEQDAPRVATPRRRPHPDIAGRATILGDVVSTLPATAWDLPA